MKVIIGSWGIVFIFVFIGVCKWWKLICSVNFGFSVWICDYDLIFIGVESNDWFYLWYCIFSLEWSNNFVILV